MGGDGEAALAVILPQWGLEGRLAQPQLLGQSSTGVLASFLAT